MSANQYVRRYKFNIKHNVVSATSSTPYPGTLHTAIPNSPAACEKKKKVQSRNEFSKKHGVVGEKKKRNATS